MIKKCYAAFDLDNNSATPSISTSDFDKEIKINNP